MLPKSFHLETNVDLVMVTARSEQWEWGGRDARGWRLATDMRIGIHDCIYIARCTLFTVHSILHAVHCTLYTISCTLYIVHCTLYLARCTLFTVHSILHAVNCILYTIHCTLYTVQWMHEVNEISE